MMNWMGINPAALDDYCEPPKPKVQFELMDAYVPGSKRVVCNGCWGWVLHVPIEYYGKPTCPFCEKAEKEASKQP